MPQRREPAGSPKGGRYAPSARPDEQSNGKGLSLNPQELDYQFEDTGSVNEGDKRISTGEITWTFPKVPIRSEVSAESQAFYGTCPKCDEDFENFYYSNLVSIMERHVLTCYGLPA